MRKIEGLIGNAEAFPILKQWDFYNHAGVAPLPHAAAEAIRLYAQQAEDAAYLTGHWHAQIAQLRESSAKLINAHRDEIAFVKNTSEGLALVASAIDWKPGDRIVTTGVEYPANIYPWMNAEKLHGAELVLVPEEGADDGSRSVPTEKILDAAQHPRTRLVTLSHVEYSSGQRHDLETIGTFCQERGIRFCVDGIQSLGVSEVDVRKMRIDYFSADGHKWLLGPEGAGIFYCRRELLAETRPLTIGWLNVVDAMNYGKYDFTLKPTAERFECGSLNVPGLLAMKASVDLLMEIGVANISARLTKLTEQIIAGVRGKGYTVISPRRQGMASAIVSFVGHFPPEPLAISLRKEHRVEIAVREGRLRVSPHFYNTAEQIDRLIGLLPDNR